MEIATPSVMPSIFGGWWYNWIKRQFRTKLNSGNEKASCLNCFLYATGRLLLVRYCDAGISIADTSISDSEVASSRSKANNSCASARITITMTPVSLPDK